jgi:hypothetical protein
MLVKNKKPIGLSGAPSFAIFYGRENLLFKLSLIVPALRID